MQDKLFSANQWSARLEIIDCFFNIDLQWTEPLPHDLLAFESQRFLALSSLHIAAELDVPTFISWFVGLWIIRPFPLQSNKKKGPTYLFLPIVIRVLFRSLCYFQSRLTSSYTPLSKNCTKHYKINDRISLQGWETLTNAVVKQISDQCTGVVFLLWGAYAAKKALVVDAKKHHLLKSVHPSPLSAHRGFLGCQHFSLCNEILENQGKSPIDWKRLDDDLD